MIMSASCHLFYIVTRPRGLPLRGNGAKIVRQVAVARRDLACPLPRAALVSRCDQNFFHIIIIINAQRAALRAAGQATHAKGSGHCHARRCLACCMQRGPLGVLPKAKRENALHRGVAT